MLVTYPVEPDSWSESLNPTEGIWQAIAGEIRLDRYNKVNGEASIENYSGVYNYYVAIKFVLDNGKEFDGTQVNAKLRFIHAVDAHYTGTVEIFLIDVYGNIAYRETVTNPGGGWEQKEYKLGSGQGWSDAGFDWTSIKEIWVYCWQKSGEAGNTWIDTPHFEYEVREGTLIVDSSPRGKTGQITYLGQTYNFETPSQTPVLPVGTEVLVEIDSADFRQWQDGDTNPSRIETIVEGTKTIKAFYEEAVPARLTIHSLDQNGNNYPGSNAVRIVYAGIEQYIDVPFSGGLIKGSYALVAEPPADREFSHWTKPDGTTTTNSQITFNLQEDTEVTVHWTRKEGPPDLTWLAPLVILGFIGGVYIIVKGA